MVNAISVLGSTGSIGRQTLAAAEHLGLRVAALTAQRKIDLLEQQARQRGLNILFTDIRPGFVDTALLNDDFPYPMLMRPEKVARDIVRSISLRRHVRVIDWRYRILTFFWRLIPGWLWRRLKI